MTKREIARGDYDKLLDKIAAARNFSYRKGLMSTEVWLGPKEREVLATEWFYSKINGVFHDNTDFYIFDSVEMLMPKLKNITIYGLTIRFSEENGVRAGITFD